MRISCSRQRKNFSRVLGMCKLKGDNYGNMAQNTPLVLSFSNQPEDEEDTGVQ